ncbi:hypothetical protein AVEN_233313-1 [Araneus ventricosus]|uniref:Uncharacterized protein n=1 Tax=Araneus ventricosus TaxID=182803 RepID=A0A4Y2S777_ARAVE|nr:hypothetical protein AVEN_233313-1 [Araneus ventricosus]
MKEVSCTTSYELLVPALLEQELKQCENPHVTYETLVLRLVKRLLLQLNLPWSHVLETVRQGPCLMDEKLLDKLQKMWNRRKRPVTLDEQHCVERVLGHDDNLVGDMMKLASVLNKIADPSDVYHFFSGWTAGRRSQALRGRVSVRTRGRAISSRGGGAVPVRRGTRGTSRRHEENVGRSVGRRGCQ